MTVLTMRLARAPDGSIRHIPTPFVPSIVKGKPKPKRTPPDPMRTDGSGAAEQLRLLIERLERLHEERAGISEDIRDVEAEAKATGFDVKGVRTILRLRKMEPHQRQETDAIVETYRVALGMD